MTRNELVRILRYVVLTFSIPFVVGTFLILSGSGEILSRISSAQDANNNPVVSTLIISPVVESIIMVMIWKMLASKSNNRSNLYYYYLIITASAFVTHGGGIGALFPSMMFAVSAVYLNRSMITYGLSYTSAFCGILTIHVLFNIPSIVLN